jgi:putative transcriptional regulator
MDIPLGKGVFLIATPALRDPNFRQTVILLCEHGRGASSHARAGRPTPSGFLRRASAKR